MDTQGEIDRIEAFLALLDAVRVQDGSAHKAFAHVVEVVNRINLLLSQVHEQAYSGRIGPSDDVFERLREWIDRLVTKLTEIVTDLADGTSFSITVGTGVSVTVNFPPHGSPQTELARRRV
jgi:hypothetical protein